MVKRALIFLLIVSVFVCSVCAESLSKEDEVLVSKGLSVIFDCATASVLTSYSKQAIELPCQYLNLNEQSHLPEKASYLIADPYEYSKMVATTIGMDKSNVISSFLAFISSKPETDPRLSVLYLLLSSKNYKQGAYLISGYVNFEFVCMEDASAFFNAWINKLYSEKTISMIINATVSGSEMPKSVSVLGRFNLSLDENGTPYLISNDTFRVNDQNYSNGKFRL